MRQYHSTLRTAETLFTSARAVRAVATALLLFFLCLNATAGNWYVRPAQQGTATGADWNNAWSMAGLNGNWSRIQPGDTIWIGGGTYTAGMRPGKSGTAGNPIYIKRPLATDAVPTAASGWSSAFDAQVIIAPSGEFPCLITGTGVGSWTYFDGRVDSGISFRLDNNTGGSYPGAVTIQSGLQHDITFTNCDLAGPGGSTAYNFKYYCTAFTAYCWNGSSYNYVTNINLTHCRLHGAPEIVNIYQGENITFDHCIIYDNDTDYAANGFHPNIWEVGSPRNYVIRYCDISGWSTEGFRPYHSCGTLSMYGNVFHDPVHGGNYPLIFEPDSGVSGPMGPIYFYNNTVVGMTYLCWNARGVSYDPASQIRNNIYWNVSSLGTPPSDSDYNYANFSLGEAHSINGSGQNPFVNLAAYNYHLTSGISSVLPRNKGLSLPASFNQDPDGNLRGGADGAWDIGAYEYGTSGPQTNAMISVSPSSLGFGSIAVGSTKDLSFTVQNVGAATLTGAATVAAPFSVVTGGSYSLGANQSQAVTIRFSPTSVASSSQTVSFTGGGGANPTVTGVGISTNLPPVVSAITGNGSDVDPITGGLQVFAGSVVQYAGSATDPNGNPMTWQWIYTVNGGAEVVYQSGSGTVSPATFNYLATMAGQTFVWKLRVSDGQATAESTLTVGVEAPPVAGGLTFQAGAGTITAPYVLSGGSISQAVETGVAAGGRALYNFTITNAGNYVIQALISAPNDAANSIYFNVDGEPLDPSMISDIPMTTGFEQRVLSWRGAGTFDNNQFVPKVLALGTGAHQIIFRGREANVQLTSFSIIQLPQAPSNLRIVAGP